MTPEYKQAGREYKAAAEVERHLVAALNLVREQKFQLQQLVSKLYAKENSASE